MNEQYDGFTTLPLGMNAQKDPFLLTAQQCARAVNVTFRGGLAKTRPGFVQDLVNLPPGGEFQGAGVWRRPEGDVIVFVQIGVLYTLRLTNYKLVRYGKRFTPGTRCQFIQADQYFIVMDGEQYPVVLESRYDVIKRRPQSSDELAPPEGEEAPVPPVYYQSLPPSALGVFAQGRLHIVPRDIPTTKQSGKSSLLSGDIMEPLYPQTVLKFSETEYLSEGGAHAMPFQLGAIGALGAFRNAATGTGTGQVIVFADNGVCAYDFSIPRAQWKEQVLSQVLFFGCGCNSPWSVVSINNDLVYRSQGGIRTIKYTQAQTASGNGTLANLPMSNEVETFLKDDTLHLPWISTAAWDNRVVSACHGSTRMFERYFQGLVVWDTAANYYNGVASTGVYDGLWTGLDVAQVLSARERGLGRETLYMLTKDMALFHVDPEATTDWCPAPDGYGDEYLQYSPIVSRIESAVLPFGDLVVSKQLKWAELWVKDVPGNTIIKMWYRPSGYPLWTRMGDTRTIAVGPGDTVHPLLRRRLRFPVEVEDCACDPSTGHPLWLGTGFQLAIEWTGNLTLERATACAVALQEAPPQPCDEEEAVIAEAACSGELLDDYSYAIDFAYEFSAGLEGGLWRLNDDEADPVIPDAPVTDNGKDPETWEPPVDPPTDGNPPELPPYNDEGGDDGDDATGSIGGPDDGEGYTPPPVEPSEPETVEAPDVDTGAFSSVTATGAVITGWLYGLSDTYPTASVCFYYKAYSATAWTATTPVTVVRNVSGANESFSATLSGLTSETTYQYKAVAVVSGVTEELLGSMRSFRTAAAVVSGGLRVTTVGCSGIGDRQVTLLGTLEDASTEALAAEVSVFFAYWKKSDQPFAHVVTTTPTTLSALSSFTAVVTGLLPGEVYSFQARATALGTSVYGAVMDVILLAERTVPVVETSDPVDDAGNALLNGELVQLGAGVEACDAYFQVRAAGDSIEDPWVPAETTEIASTQDMVAPGAFTAVTAYTWPSATVISLDIRACVDYTTAAGSLGTVYGPVVRFTLPALEVTGPDFVLEDPTDEVRDPNTHVLTAARLWGSVTELNEATGVTAELELSTDGTDSSAGTFEALPGAATAAGPITVRADLTNIDSELYYWYRLKVTWTVDFIPDFTPVTEYTAARRLFTGEVVVDTNNQLSTTNGAYFVSYVNETALYTAQRSVSSVRSTAIAARSELVATTLSVGTEADVRGSATRYAWRDDDGTVVEGCTDVRVKWACVRYLIPEGYSGRSIRAIQVAYRAYGMNHGGLAVVGRVCFSATATPEDPLSGGQEFKRSFSCTAFGSSATMYYQTVQFSHMLPQFTGNYYMFVYTYVGGYASVPEPAVPAPTSNNSSDSESASVYGLVASRYIYFYPVP